jgi:hypothetical protein
VTGVTTQPAADFDVVVIGAGMAGLAAAGDLVRAGRRVLAIDKGRGVGGRVASRRVGEATFDHGAQFVTARTPRFAAWLDQARGAGVAREWCRGFNGDADAHPRWRGQPAMTALAKHLAQGLAVELEQQVAALRPAGDGWQVETVGGVVRRARALVLTPPVPQSLALLGAGGVTLDDAVRARLEGVDYERCLAVMAVLDGPSRLPGPGGLAPPDPRIVWMADNGQKGISAVPSVTLHGGHDFSLQHWDRDRQEAGRLLLEAARPWLGTGVTSFQVHGWRFSRPMQTLEEGCVVASERPLLVLAGDAFAEPRVEGAVVSGWAAAEAVLARAS